MGKSHLQVPEEESEDQADAEAHEPGDKHERGAFDVGKVTKDGHPFRDLAGRLGENFALSNKKKSFRILDPPIETNSPITFPRRFFKASLTTSLVV